MNNPRITVITVCFNSASTIRDTLKSIASQTCKDFEHVIVDGGSTDETLDIIRRWTQHPIRLVSESDNGIYDAMNKGLALATGEVVGFLNADDFYADESVLGQIAKVFNDSMVDACYADLVYVSKDSTRIIRYWKSSPFKTGAFASGWCPAHPTFYVRKSVIDWLGNFDRSFRLAVDVELMMRYLERAKISSVYVPRVWVRMRVGGESNRNMNNILGQNREILRALRKNNIPVAPFIFVTAKILNRIGQFLYRPHEK